MAKLSVNGFAEAMPSELALFTLPPTQVAVVDSYLQEIRPSSSIGGDVPIEFRISAANGLDYLDLKGSQLYVKLKVTKSDGRAGGDGQSWTGKSVFAVALLYD